MDEKDIRIQDIFVDFMSETQNIRAVDGISLILKAGRITGIIGETGCGKSVLGMSLIRLLPDNAQVRGQVFFQGADLLRMSGRELRSLRRKGIALVPQSPGTSLNPVMKIKTQLEEALGPGLAPEANGLLSAFGLENAGGRYPFELSGGMKQRVLTAMGLGRRPLWLLADEPTKGLDARLRHQTRDMLKRAHISTGSGMIIITHDIGLAQSLCDDIAVMYAGKLVETGPADLFFNTPCHPYSKALLKAGPHGGFTPIPGRVPDLACPPSGCRFHPGCPEKKSICTEKSPEPRILASGQKVYCHA